MVWLLITERNTGQLMGSVRLWACYYFGLALSTQEQLLNQSMLHLRIPNLHVKQRNSSSLLNALQDNFNGTAESRLSLIEMFGNKSKTFVSHLELFRL